jgi:RNA polymerase sigma-70 factor (ECF subfamily)
LYRVEVQMTADHVALLRALHDEHGPVLFRYVMHLTGDYPYAQDVVQESLLRAWQHPGILEQGEGSARAWLFTVARNLVIDHRRSARYSKEFITDDIPEVQGPDGSEAVLNAWLLSDALLSLSLEHRRAVVNCYYLGHTVAEIARKEGVPEGTIKSRLHYALRALRLALQERGVTR